MDMSRPAAELEARTFSDPEAVVAAEPTGEPAVGWGAVIGGAVNPPPTIVENEG